MNTAANYLLVIVVSTSALILDSVVVPPLIPKSFLAPSAPGRILFQANGNTSPLMPETS